MKKNNIYVIDLLFFRSYERIKSTCLEEKVGVQVCYSGLCCWYCVQWGGGRKLEGRDSSGYWRTPCL